MAGDEIKIPIPRPRPLLLTRAVSWERDTSPRPETVCHAALLPVLSGVIDQTQLAYSSHWEGSASGSSSSTATRWTSARNRGQPSAVPQSQQ
jgi:hypothetical protein